MLSHKRSIILINIVSLIYFIDFPNLFSMKQPAQPLQEQVLQQQEHNLIKQLIKDELRIIREEISKVREHVDDSVFYSNYAAKLTYNALEEAIKSHDLANATTAKIEQSKDMLITLEHQIPDALANLQQEVLNAEKRVSEAAEKERALKLEDKIKIAEQAAIAAENEKAKLGVKINAVNANWQNLKNTISDPQIIAKIAAAIVTTALCIYAIKYGMPALIKHFSKPYIISETSKRGLLGWFKSRKYAKIEDLVFTPSLQMQLSNLTVHVQSAKKYKESLPNVIFYGAPGTGKTAFAKALAYASGLDYALTSGSEFAKIKDLNTTNNELRKLLNWAKKSKGLIIFIDEAESLFANRKFATTSKKTQDFINTFLSLVSDQSQKDVMFIFATNHPFKLDDAIVNRIGMNIEFTLPGAKERSLIISRYIVKLAQENEDAIVNVHPEISQTLSKYANDLEGFSPRAIKFIVETMIAKARHQEPKLLNNDIAQAVIDEAKQSHQNTLQWDKEHNEWAKTLSITQIK